LRRAGPEWGLIYPNSPEILLRFTMNRRQFINRTGISAAVVSVAANAPSLFAQHRPTSKMKIDLTFPKLGMKCDQTLAIELAAKNGFQSVGGDTNQITAMNDAQLGALNELRASKNLVWGTCGFPVDFRRDDETFRKGLSQLREVCVKINKLGIPRMTTWISPSNNNLTYRQNFSRHVARLKIIDSILAEQDIRLGLEYVGTQLLRFDRKHPFIHTSAEMLELIGETGGTQLGLILDSWHWWTSGESTEDLRSIKPTQIVSVEVNDAPKGIEREQQKDNQRGLPGTTGVLPINDFLTTVAASGFEGPVMAEPFYAPLRSLPPAEAANEVAKTLKATLASIS